MREHTERLDPVRLRPPRLRPLLRYALVAALLALAAGVLLLERPAPAGSARCPAVPRSSPSPAGDRTLAVPPGTVGVPVQLAEPATAAVLRPGDRVDVVARVARPGASPGAASTAPTSGNPSATDHSESVVLARDVLVLSVNSYADRSPDEGVIYLAMKKDQAQRVARTAPDVALGVTVRPR